MTGEERRSEIINTMRQTKTPISGSALARKFQVSRQVIVQDIALLRASNVEIDSTSRGYRLAETDSKPEMRERTETAVRRVFQVCHTDEQIEDELNTIVDMGGKALDVFVDHNVYGAIRADLSIFCRRHVREFVENISAGTSVPLKNLTSGVHYHTVEADSEEILDLIEKELDKKGYLMKGKFI